jgi:hypothetical protein
MVWKSFVLVLVAEKELVNVIIYRIQTLTVAFLTPYCGVRRDYVLYMLCRVNAVGLRCFDVLTNIKENMGIAQG